MAWIELHQSLFTHRKTMAAADALDIPEVYVVAHLAALWTWALDNAPNGVIDASPRILARACQWNGDATQLIDALLLSGFLVKGDAEREYVIHDWHDYAGKLIERRQANAERMKRARSGNAAAPVQEESQQLRCTCDARASHVPVVCGATQPNPTQPNQDVSTASESGGHLAGAREGEPPAGEWPAEGEVLPPPPGDPFDSRDDWQQRETAARQEAGRRNQPVTDLFIAFRRGKWPHKPPEWHETYPTAELREAFETLRALHQDGVTPEQMQSATERCLVEYSNPTRVTVDAIARAWTTLTEPPGKIIGAKPPGAGSNGQQQPISRASRKLVQ